MTKSLPKDQGIFKLLRDPYVLISAGAIAFGIYGMGTVEAILPMWMLENWHSKSFERGSAFLPNCIGYMISTKFFGHFGHRFGRYPKKIKKEILDG